MEESYYQWICSGLTFLLAALEIGQIFMRAGGVRP